jgi:soluble lytic murein transglycosylase-like protein
MGALRAALALALVAAPLPAQAQDATDRLARWRPLIAEAAARFALPPEWIERVMRAESAGRTHLNGRPIRSRAGAIGLMQLMPATWAVMRDALGLGADPDDPRANILAGTAYLRLMYDRFGYPGAFAAYNAGPGRYGAWLAGRSALPGETRAYLVTVVGTGGRGVAAPSSRSGDAPAPPRQGLFVVRYGDHPAGAQGAISAVGNGLFAIRNDGQ